MKICPVCNDSFADTLNFCDIDGARLTREGSVQDRNKWWSLIGAGLLVGALVISAASIFFLPKSRPAPIVSSEPQPVPAPSKPASTEGGGNGPATQVASAEPEGAPGDATVPEVKKKDKALVNGNFSGTTPNPKAAALAAEDGDKKAHSAEGNTVVPVPLSKPEATPLIKSSGETRPAEAAVKPATPPELKKDPKAQPTIGKNSEKDSNDKKKADEKDKKKGGFLRVFKKIFGKD
jgi:hypothetical protein